MMKSKYIMQSIHSLVIAASLALFWLPAAHAVELKVNPLIDPEFRIECTYQLTDTNEQPLPATMQKARFLTSQALVVNESAWTAITPDVETCGLTFDATQLADGVYFYSIKAVRTDTGEASVLSYAADPLMFARVEILREVGSPKHPLMNGATIPTAALPGPGQS